MNLSTTISPSCVVLNEKLDGKEAALVRIAELAAESPALSGIQPDAIARELQAREVIGSTGFGDGIAIPHCRFPNVPEFVVGIVTVDGGIDFDAVDKQPVRIIAFIIGPESETTRHLKILSALSLALSSEPTRAAMLAATTPKALVEAVAGGRSFPEPEQQAENRLFHLIVQDESIFDRLLEVFEGIDGASVTVIESRNSGSYLARLPLFASLLSDAPGSYNRVIVATVRRAISNEAIRRIEMVAGSLDEREDLLVVVQDVHYMAGGLSI